MPFFRRLFSTFPPHDLSQSEEHLFNDYGKPTKYHFHAHAKYVKQINIEKNKFQTHKTNKNDAMSR